MNPLDPYFPDIRTGLGFDVHPLLPGEGIWLGGILIPCPYKLKGHSDADALLHAICDAILGAISEGDIGLHFPPSDPQWAGKASKHFVEHACKLTKNKGATLLNIDTVIISEKPKISPYRLQMQEEIAQITSLDLSRVNIKATTTEKLGFTGRGEGLAAQAIATVRFS